MYFNFFFTTLCTWFVYSIFSAFSEVTILAAFNVLVISSSRANGAFLVPASNVFHVNSPPVGFTAKMAWHGVAFRI